MSDNRRTFSKEFKLQILEEVDDGVPMAELSRRYKLSRTTIWKWRQSLENSPVNPFPGKGKERKPGTKKIAQMERLIGRLSMENDFLKNALSRLKGGGK